MLKALTMSDFFLNSEDAEFFAASSLVFAIFSRNFKMAGWESYKAKTFIAYIYVVYLGDAAT